MPMTQQERAWGRELFSREGFAAMGEAVEPAAVRKRCQEPLIDVENVEVRFGESNSPRRREGRKGKDKGVIPHHESK